MRAEMPGQEARIGVVAATSGRTDQDRQLLSPEKIVRNLGSRRMGDIRQRGTSSDDRETCKAPEVHARAFLFLESAGWLAGHGTNTRPPFMATPWPVI
jgi:hypothetical protein